MARNMLPDLAFLNECFLYDPETGALQWRERPVSHFADEPHSRMWNTRFSGKVITCISHQGYVVVRMAPKTYLVQHIVWKMQTGNDCMSGLQIDHKKRDRTDNRIANLREVTWSQNSTNSSVRKSQTGMKGVTPRQRADGTTAYRAQITIDGCGKYLGSFPTAVEAHAVYCEAAKKYFGAFWTDGT
jgi:HNH endonuclease